MRRDERGYIVVETIMCFTLFIFLNISILSLINIVTVQARVHYALTQAAEAVSIYTYTLDVLGVSDHIVASAQTAETAEEELNTVKIHINSFIDAVRSLNISDTLDSGDALIRDGVKVVEDIENEPEKVFQKFLNYNLQEGMDFLFEGAVRPLVGWYLRCGELSGDEYLRAFHVEKGLRGLDFKRLSTFDLSATATGSDTRFLTGSETVKLVVEYDIDYTFGTLPLGFTKLHIVQSAETRSWLNGSGEGYTKMSGEETPG